MQSARRGHHCSILVMVFRTENKSGRTKPKTKTKINHKTKTTLLCALIAQQAVSAVTLYVCICVYSPVAPRPSACERGVSDSWGRSCSLSTPSQWMTRCLAGCLGYSSYYYQCVVVESARLLNDLSAASHRRSAAHTANTHRQTKK